VSTDQYEEDEDAYWLWYDSNGGKLSVSRKRLDNFDTLLRLKLCGHPDEDSQALIPPGGCSISNVGTKLLFQDDFVNIWEFRLAPQEQCHFHVHKLKYCFTNLSESVTQALDEDGKEVGSPNPQTKGQTVYVDKESLGSHAVLNVGSTTFLQFIAEFKF
jgi:hypothetical protein